jgi:glycosyltransferase involved in cell wall biosynthesis
MLTKKMLITVIVCTYNRERTLETALHSILGQETDADFEIVVVNDGATDGTAGLIHQLAAVAGRPMRCVETAGIGIPSARNRGVEEARGEWIAFFDDDQIAERDWLREMLRAARETDAEIVGGVRRLQFAGVAPSTLGPLTREVLGEKDYGPCRDRTNRFTLACTGNILMKKSLFDRIGGFDASLRLGMSDIDLGRRALDAGISSWYTPSAVVWHLIPPYRLEESYLKWTCLRVGTNLARINCKSWGPGRMLVPCLLRVGHALSVNAILAGMAKLLRGKAFLLDRKCYYWMSVGSARMALNLLLPRTFPQEPFFKRLEFRAERTAFRSAS